MDAYINIYMHMQYNNVESSRHIYTYVYLHFSSMQRRNDKN